MNRIHTDEWIKRLKISMILLRMDREESTSRHEVHYIDKLIADTENGIKKLMESKKNPSKFQPRFYKP